MPCACLATGLRLPIVPKKVLLGQNPNLFGLPSVAPGKSTRRFGKGNPLTFPTQPVDFTQLNPLTSPNSTR